VPTCTTITSAYTSGTFTPSAHAATHAAAGSDPVTLTEAQITNLSTDLAAKVTTVTGTAPIVSSGGATPAVSCATCGVTGSPLSQFAATTSLQLAGVLSDETGTGAAVFSTSPTLVTPALGTPSALVATNATGTAASLTAGAATALAANGTNCAAGNYPLGVDAGGNSESCTSLAPQKIRAIGYTFDGGGAALTSGVTKYLTVPFACTISAWNIAVDTGTATIKTWKIATGTAVPTVSNTISTSGVAISSGTAVHSATVTDFTSTAVTANDIFGFNLFAVSSATQVNFIIECDQ
jgi:hypothetical protein